MTTEILLIEEFWVRSEIREYKLSVDGDFSVPIKKIQFDALRALFGFRLIETINSSKVLKVFVYDKN